MNRNIKFAIVLMIGLSVIAVFGQQPKPDPQAEFKAAQKRLTEAESAKDAALSAFAAALADRNAVLYKMMAEAGAKPSQCAVGGNPFACVKVDPKTGDISFSKPEPSPKP